MFWLGLVNILGFFSFLHFDWLYVLNLDSIFFSSRTKSQSWCGLFEAPLWPAWFSRVSRWTAVTLILLTTFPWHTISPSSNLFVFSSTCLNISTTWACRLFLAWLNWWSKGPTEQNNLQTFYAAQGFSHYFPFSTAAMMRTKHFLSLKVAILPFNACVMWACHLFIHRLCTNLIIFSFYFLADNSHFISIKLCLFTAICCCNLLELSA